MAFFGFRYYEIGGFPIGSRKTRSPGLVLIAKTKARMAMQWGEVSMGWVCHPHGNLV